MDKFQLREHMQFGVECISASWKDEGFWEVRLLDIRTNIEYIRTATIFISAVGGISKPRDIRFPGMEKFQGDIIHTARWDPQFVYSGKRLAVIGNGCSAAQVVPAIAKKAGLVKQYARSAQWYHERPNRAFTAFEKWCFRNVPLWERYLRLRLFITSDSLVATYIPGAAAEKLRVKAENGARRYIRETAPKKYHKELIPDFPLGMFQLLSSCTPVHPRSYHSCPLYTLSFSIIIVYCGIFLILFSCTGCKRRIFDPNYLESLHRSNVELASVGINHFDETGIVSLDGVRTEFDAVVLATGFDVQQFIVPMEIYGKDGRSLSQQWKESRGAQAYMGTYVHNFPNMGIL